MPKFSKKRPFARKSRPSKYARKTNNTKKMMGHAMNYALQRAKGAGGYIGMLARNVDLIKSFINVETKYLDIANNTAASSALNSYSIVLNPVVEGDDYFQRQGRSILNDSLTLNYTYTANAGALQTFCRVIVVADLKPDIGAAVISDVLGGSAGFLTQIDKASNGDRFVILKSMILSTNANNPNMSGKIHLNLKGTHTLFDATTSDHEKNKLYIMAVSDQATNAPALAFYSRFRYKDN